MELALISYQLAIPQSPGQTTYLGRDSSRLVKLILPSFYWKYCKVLAPFNMSFSIDILDTTTTLLDHGMMRVKQRIEEGQL